MINSSTDFATAIAGDDREFTSRLSVNGTELDGSIDTWTLTKGSCGGSEFVVGSVMGSVFTCTIKNLTANVKNEDIKVEIGLMVNGAYEYITLGYFTASEVKKTPYQTAITAYGHSVSKTGGVISSLSSQTLASVRQALSTATGVTVTLPSSVDTTLTIDESLAGMTGYQILQVLASVIGGYVVDEADGSIGIKLYDATPTLSVTEDRMLALPDVEEQNFTITGISCTAGENTYTSGTVNVEMDDEFMTSDLFTNECAPNLIGYSYRPATITLSKGDPRLEGIDVLEVGSYAVPCHSVSHTFDGGLSTRVESIRATMIGDGEATPAPISTRIKDNEKKITVIGKIASDTNQYFWFTETGTDTGAHITEIPQDEFKSRTAVDPTDGGGNLLARNNGIAVRDGLIELASFSSDGVAVGAEGNARQYLTSDELLAVDENGTTAFRIGMNSGTIQYVRAIKDQPPNIYDRIEFDLSTVRTQTGSAECEFYRCDNDDLIVAKFFGLGITLDDSHTFVSATGTSGEYNPYSGAIDHFLEWVWKDYEFTRADEPFLSSTITITTDSDTVVVTITATVSANADAMDVTVTSSSSVVTSAYLRIASITANIESTAPAMSLGTTSADSGGLSATIGQGLDAHRNYQTVIGKYNKPDTKYPENELGYYAFIVGNGDIDTPSNSIGITWHGDLDFELGSYESLCTQLTNLGWLNAVISDYERPW